MRKVVRLEEEKKKPIELTHYQDFNGWNEVFDKPEDYNKIVYLGKCKLDGDMFCCYMDGYIEIFKGHLNDGVY